MRYNEEFTIVAVDRDGEYHHGQFNGNMITVDRHIRLIFDTTPDYIMIRAFDRFDNLISMYSR